MNQINLSPHSSQDSSATVHLAAWALRRGRPYAVMIAGAVGLLLPLACSIATIDFLEAKKRGLSSEHLPDWFNWAWALAPFFIGPVIMFLFVNWTQRALDRLQARCA